MMGHVVFAVVMGTLLCEAMTVPPRSSTPCESGPHCLGESSISRMGSTLFCCPEPNTAIDVSSSSVDGLTTYSCHCRPVDAEEVRGEMEEEMRQANQVIQDVQDEIYRQHEESMKMVANMRRNMRDLL